MKKLYKNKVLFVAITAFLLFVLYNGTWFLWSTQKYGAYSKGLEKFDFNSYVLAADDGYLYNVKYPDYLSLTGNLCVATEDDRLALIIWPQVFGKAKFALQIGNEKTDEITHLNVDESLNPLEPTDSKLIDDNFTDFKKLLAKAKKQWPNF